MPQPLPARTAEPQNTSARTDMPQPTPDRTAEPQSPPTRTDEPQPVPASNSNFAERHETILQQRTRIRDSQLSQAEKMVTKSRVDLKSGEVGGTVAIPLHMVER